MKVLAGQSIAVRLAASAVFWSLFILLIAGLIPSALYRETTERAFDQRLLVYANDLASDLVAQDPADAEERDLGIGDPRFDIPLSAGIGRSAARARSPATSARPNPFSPASCRVSSPRRRTGASATSAGLCRGTGRPGLAPRGTRHRSRRGRPLRRPPGRPRRRDRPGRAACFVFALTVTFALLGLALGSSTLLQIRFGLAPL